MYKRQHQNNGVALVHALDGLVIASNNGQDIVIQSKLGRTNLVTLRGNHDRSSVELAIVAQVVDCLLYTSRCV